MPMFDLKYIPFQFTHKKNINFHHYTCVFSGLLLSLATDPVPSDSLAAAAMASTDMSTTLALSSLSSSWKWQIYNIDCETWGKNVFNRQRATQWKYC